MTFTRYILILTLFTYSNCLEERPSGLISMKSLLCEHDKLSFDPNEYWDNLEGIDNQVFRIANQETYQMLSKYYDLDERKITTDMPICYPCLNKLKEIQSTQDLYFQNATMLVYYKIKVQPRKSKRATKTSAITSDARIHFFLFHCMILRHFLLIILAQYQDMEVEVYDVNFDDTVYELKLKMQQNLDYAPNRFPRLSHF